MSRPETPPPPTLNLPFGATPSPATGDRLLSRKNDDEDDQHQRKRSDSTKSTGSNRGNNHKHHHHHKHHHDNNKHHDHPNVSVVYAVDADIRRPSSPIYPVPNSPTTPAVVTNSSDGKVGAESAGAAAAASSSSIKSAAKRKRKIKTRTVETQTKLSYCGDYEHGRPILIHSQEDPECYTGKALAALLMFGIVVDLVIGSISYFVNWRIRDPLLMEIRNQDFFSKVYPAALVCGLFVAFGVSLPTLSWIVSGYLEAKRYDKYFLFAQTIWTLFVGLPFVLVESLWVGPLDREEIKYYFPESIVISQFALAIHCLVAGGSLWYFYLIFCSRTLNDAVEGRRQKWIQYQRAILSGKKCEASRIAIKTAEEIEASQQEKEMFSIDEIVASKSIAAGYNGKGARFISMMSAMSGVANGGADNYQNHQEPHPGGDEDDPHAPVSAARKRTFMLSKKKPGGDGISTSPLPDPSSTLFNNNNASVGEFTIGGKKFSVVNSAASGADAADDVGMENGWGTPFKEEVIRATPPPSSQNNDDDNDQQQRDQDEGEEQSSAAVVNVPGSPFSPASNNGGATKKKNSNKKDGTTTSSASARGVSFVDPNQNDNDDLPPGASTRNVVDDDDPFVKR